MLSDTHTAHGLVIYQGVSQRRVQRPGSVSLEQ